MSQAPKVDSRICHHSPSHTVFEPVLDDEYIIRHCWNIIQRDIPVLAGPTTLTPNDQLIRMFGALRQDHASQRAANKVRRLADKQDKLPSVTPNYKTIACKWMQFCLVTDEADLPPVYHQIINGDKSKHITILCNAIRERARSPGAVSTNQVIPVVSKETKEMLLMCQFGIPAHELHDLPAGLQPFAVGYFWGEKLGRTVESCAMNYEQMMAGLSTPIWGEQATFPTKKFVSRKILLLPV